MGSSVCVQRGGPLVDTGKSCRNPSRFPMDRYCGTKLNHQCIVSVDHRAHLLPAEVLDCVARRTVSAGASIVRELFPWRMFYGHDWACSFFITIETLAYLSFYCSSHSAWDNCFTINIKG